MKKLFVCLGTIIVIQSCKTENQESIQSVDSSGIKVKTERVALSIAKTEFNYSGTVEASSVIPLTFQTGGTVEQVLVDAGDKVQKGQLLATTEQTDAQNTYKLSLAKYEQAKDAYDRLKTVYEQGSLAEIKWVEMQSNLEQAKSSLAMAKNNVEKCFLRASVDGFVGKRNIEPSMSAIVPSGAAIELVEISEVLIKVSAPENEIGRIAKGQDVSIHVAALNDAEFRGAVKTISPIADVVSRTYTVKILVKNPNFLLKPGMVCDVTLDSDSQVKNIEVPYQSINQDTDKTKYVYVVDQSTQKVKKQSVITGNYHGSKVEIKSGLQLGQTIVVEGKEKLTDNVSVVF